MNHACYHTALEGRPPRYIAPEHIRDTWVRSKCHETRAGDAVPVSIRKTSIQNAKQGEKSSRQSVAETPETRPGIRPTEARAKTPGGKQCLKCEVYHRQTRLKRATKNVKCMKQAMRAAGLLPAFPHLRAVCTYPEERFGAWLERTAAAAAVAAESLLGDRSAPPPRPPRGRRPSGVGDGAPRPSIRTTSLAELGLTYAVRGSGSGSSLRRRQLQEQRQRQPRPRRREGAPAAEAEEGSAETAAMMAAAAAAEERDAFFAPGRAEVKALVRRLSRGLDVLDLCCGTGGFALNAAAGKARSALGVRAWLRPRGRYWGGGGAVRRPF